MTAYLVWAADCPEEGQEIVVASSATEAKRRSELRWSGVPRKLLRARRYPRFTGYDHITERDLLLDGWTFTCPECARDYNLALIHEAGAGPDTDLDGRCPYCYASDYGLEAVIWDGDLVLIPRGEQR